MSRAPSSGAVKLLRHLVIQLSGSLATYDRSNLNSDLSITVAFESPENDGSYVLKLEEDTLLIKYNGTEGSNPNVFKKLIAIDKQLLSLSGQFDGVVMGHISRTLNYNEACIEINLINRNG